MKTSILILSIIGTVLCFVIGTCTGACLQGLSDLAEQPDDDGVKYLGLAILEAIIGLIGGIMGFRKFDVSRKGSVIAGIILLVAAIFSIHNTMQFFTSGVLFAIPAIMLLAAGGKKATASSENNVTQ